MSSCKTLIIEEKQINDSNKNIIIKKISNRSKLFI